MQSLQTPKVEVVSAAGASAALRRTESIERVRRLGILFGFVVVYGVFALLNHQFMTVPNLTAVALQSSINAIIAIGMTLVIISAGIDLSVGSIAGLASVVAATVMTTQGLVIGIAAGLIVGIIAGAINGVLIARIGLAPFIVTLGTLALFRGSALVFTNGQPIYGIPEAFRSIFAGTLGPIPTPVILAIVCALIVDFVLRRTTFGEHIVAIGGNEEAARLCGVAVGRVKALRSSTSSPERFRRWAVSCSSPESAPPNRSAEPVMNSTPSRRRSSAERVCSAASVRSAERSSAR
jgi:ribose transport system permease protein